MLLSDGKTTAGRDPVEVAEAAGRLKVPIFTVSLGTRDATVPNPGYRASPRRGARPPDARTDRGDLRRPRLHGRQLEDLSDIYKALGSQLSTRKEKREITSGFAIVGGILLVGAATASVRRAGRLP